MVHYLMAHHSMVRLMVRLCSKEELLRAVVRAQQPLGLRTPFHHQDAVFLEFRAQQLLASVAWPSHELSLSDRTTACFAMISKKYICGSSPGVQISSRGSRPRRQRSLRDRGRQLHRGEGGEDLAEIPDPPVLHVQRLQRDAVAEHLAEPPQLARCRIGCLWRV